MLKFSNLLRRSPDFKNILTNALRPPTNRTMSVMRTPDSGEEKSVRVRESEEYYRLFNRQEVNWESKKTSWKHFLRHIRNKFSSAKEHSSWGRMMKADHVYYYFRSAEDLDFWYVQTDEDVKGHSWAEFVRGENEMTATFRGNLSEKPPSHRLPSADPLKDLPDYHGFVYVETKPFVVIMDREDYMNFEHFNSVKIRIRGDGRKYLFQMLCDSADADLVRVMYGVPIHTNGGPLWQEINIPLSKFIAARDNSYLLQQPHLVKQKMCNFRFLLNDGIEGPFQLEIDYVALSRDPRFCFEGFNSNYDPWRPINMNSAPPVTST